MSGFCRICYLAQLRAYEDVLYWINEQTEQYIDKKKLYAAVLDMRPDESCIDFPLCAERAAERAAALDNLAKQDGELL
jgi:hypothetical protein